MLAIPPALSKDALRARLLSSLPDTLARLLPEGTRRGRQFVVGDVQGSAGESLQIELYGDKAGLWHDFATGEGGDVFDLFAAHFGMTGGYAFTDLLQRIETWLGNPPPLQVTKTSSQTKPKHISKLKPKLPAPTCHWTYTDADGNAVARVFRYDESGKKQFRPYDLIEGRWGAPTIRPLYNLPAVIAAKEVILVEGEKCAQALIDRGIVATTAMFGANAPLDKTDWTPLIGKHVIIWPDHDSSGQNYAQTLTQTLTALGVESLRLLSPPKNKPLKWDAVDAVAEGFDIDSFLQPPPPNPHARIPAFSITEFVTHTQRPPDDLIAPRILTPSGLLVLGGAPKVGKSDFLLTWLAHMAAGRPFLDMTPPRRLRVFYLQAEIDHAYLRERILQLSVYNDLIEAAGGYLVATPRLRLTLNEDGVREVAEVIAAKFDGKADIIVIDPIRNVYDLGGKGENDNSAMLHFLSERIDVLREMVNPQAGVILVHHTRKLQKSQFREDPFQALSGAGSLRSYYTSGMMLFRENEQREERELHFELRNGAPLPVRSIIKQDGIWFDHKAHHGRTGKPSVQEIDRCVLRLIAAEAKQGRLYTLNTFAAQFADHHEMGGFYALQKRLQELSEKTFIQFAPALPEWGFLKTTSTFGYLVTQNMRLLHEGRLVSVLPTHIKGQTKGKPEEITGTPIWPKDGGGQS